MKKGKQKMKYIGKKYLVLFLVLTLSFLVFLEPERNEIYSPCGEFGNHEAEPCSSSAEDIKISSRLWELFFGGGDGNNEGESEKVVLLPGGGVFGARIKQTHITVADPGGIKDLRSGDKIISANGKELHSSLELKRMVGESAGGAIDLTCQRGDRCFNVKVAPKADGGEYSLGLVLKDGAAGIGTITYIDPETGLFGGLGHGICDPDTGELVEMGQGDVTGVLLGGVKKGECGKPGELSGILTDKVIGTLYSNTECGVFGKLDKIPQNLDTVPIEIAHRDEVHAGEATIISTVKLGKSHEFKIEISDVNPSSTGTKSFKIKATDPSLTAITGGVVRGMSGSPIIQDGKLIGAVTHVLVANPTEGYGIFIENMLNAANNQSQQKAA